MSMLDFSSRADADAHSTRIVFHELEASSWRVCDSALPPTHPEHVVAYVERHGAMYDVVWLRGVRESEMFDTRESVCTAAMRRVSEQPSSAATRPVPIPHFPPRTR